MANIIKLKRGLNANVGTLTLEAGEPAFTTDTGKLYVGDGTTNILINPTLTKTDIGLGNVTNESKATMFTDAALTGVPTTPTAIVATNNTQIASTAFVKSQGYLNSVDIENLSIDGGAF